MKVTTQPIVKMQGNMEVIVKEHSPKFQMKLND